MGARRPLTSAWIAPVVTVAAALVVYSLTLAPDLTHANYGADGGELIAASVTLGVAHPPGYPLYSLLGKLFSYLPLGTLAFRYHLLSAAGFAAAAALVATSVYRLGSAGVSHPRRWAAASAAGMALAFTPLVWSQALIAEVYGLNLALAAAVLALCVLPAGRHKSGWIGFLWGLAISHHPTSLLLAPMVGLAAGRGRLGALVAGLAFGMTPWLLLPLLAAGDSPVVWGDPRSLEGWLWLVSGQLYQPNLFSLPRAEWLPRLFQWMRPALTAFTLLGLPIILLGSARTFQARRRLALGLAAIGLLYGLYAFLYATQDAAVYFLPGLAAISVLLGAGLLPFGRLALLLPIALLGLNFGRQDLSQAGLLRRQADQLLAAIPADALVVTPGGEVSAAFYYFHYAEGHRPDLFVVDSSLYPFDWYRRQITERLGAPAASSLDQLTAHLAAGRPVCWLDPGALAIARCRPAGEGAVT